jgi:hypothetical protein
MADLERAIGQYVMYEKALSKQEISRMLYLAMPKEVYKDLTNDQVAPILRGVGQVCVKLGLMPKVSRALPESVGFDRLSLTGKLT